MIPKQRALLDAFVVLQQTQEYSELAGPSDLEEALDSHFDYGSQTLLDEAKAAERFRNRHGIPCTKRTMSDWRREELITGWMCLAPNKGKPGGRNYRIKPDVLDEQVDNFLQQQQKKGTPKPNKPTGPNTNVNRQNITTLG